MGKDEKPKAKEGGRRLETNDFVQKKRAHTSAITAIQKAAEASVESVEIIDDDIGAPPFLSSSGARVERGERTKKKSPARGRPVVIKASSDAESAAVARKNRVQGGVEEIHDVARETITTTTTTAAAAAAAAATAEGDKKIKSGRGRPVVISSKADDAANAIRNKTRQAQASNTGVEEIQDVSRPTVEFVNETSKSAKEKQQQQEKKKKSKSPTRHRHHRHPDVDENIVSNHQSVGTDQNSDMIHSSDQLSDLNSIVTPSAPEILSNDSISTTPQVTQPITTENNDGTAPGAYFVDEEAIMEDGRNHHHHLNIDSERSEKQDDVVIQAEAVAVDPMNTFIYATSMPVKENDDDVLCTCTTGRLGRIGVVVIICIGIVVIVVLSVALTLTSRASARSNQGPDPPITPTPTPPATTPMPTMSPTPGRPSSPSVPTPSMSPIRMTEMPFVPPKPMPTMAPTVLVPTMTPTSRPPYNLPFMGQIPNLSCQFYGNEGSCSSGLSFEDVWYKCDQDHQNDDEPGCMGIMWRSCSNGSSREGNGEWRLLTAGQAIIGDDTKEKNDDTKTCKVNDRWDVYVRVHRAPDVYCKAYASGGKSCEKGKSFDEVWKRCEDDGISECMGVAWRACDASVSDTSGLGAWKLLTAGQSIGVGVGSSSTCSDNDDDGSNRFLSTREISGWNSFLRTEEDALEALKTTASPTIGPTTGPSGSPSHPPTASPTQLPSPSPSAFPTLLPSPSPSTSPTLFPSPISPTVSPTHIMPTPKPFFFSYPSPSPTFHNNDDEFLLPPMRFVRNVFCITYENGGDGSCDDGIPFTQAWEMCHEDECMGIMWNPCGGKSTTLMNDTSVNGAWGLIPIGIHIGDANNPTKDCKGSVASNGEWGAFIRVYHDPKFFCHPLELGGGGGMANNVTCESSVVPRVSFLDAFRRCDRKGIDFCSGIMWNDCDGDPKTDDINVDGVFRLIDSNFFCDGGDVSDDDEGNWEAYFRDDFYAYGDDDDFGDDDDDFGDDDHDDE